MIARELAMLWRWRYGISFYRSNS